MLEMLSVKEELLDEAQISEAADQVSLFDLKLVGRGVIELDSSSGSGSSSDSESDSSDSPVVPKPDLHAFSEEVPAGVDFYRHRKSSIVHRAKSGSKVASCGASMNANFTELPRVFTVRWPKCLKCFPKNSNRIRSVEQLTGALDDALKRARKSG